MTPSTPSTPPIHPILPPATIGMLGGGQLGRYTLIAASTMGYRTMVLDPDPIAPAAGHSDVHVVAAYDDTEALQRLAQECAVVTTEFENAPAAALAHLATLTRVAPPAAAVGIAQDRIREKSFLAENGFPVGPFAVVDGSGRPEQPSVLAAVTTHGAIVKTARLGYDGKGQRRVEGVDDALAAVQDLGGVDCVVEALLELRAELSVLVARTPHGDTACWPVAENMHVDGILDCSVVPARTDASLASAAITLATAVAESLAYVGVLAVEMFVVADEEGRDTLVVNELAPRPHNSGHWTLDASATSQFEQQVRAVCGVGLGETSLTVPAVAMVNLLGDVWFRSPVETVPTEPDWAPIFDEPSASLHLYGKAEPRPGRKMGHLTVTADNAHRAEQRARELRAALKRTPNWPIS